LDHHVPTIKSYAIAGNVLPLKEIDYRTQVFDNRALLGFALRLESPALLAVNDLSRGRERRAQTLVQADTIGFNRLVPDEADITVEWGSHRGVPG